MGVSGESLPAPSGTSTPNGYATGRVPAVYACRVTRTEGNSMAVSLPRRRQRELKKHVRSSLAALDLPSPLRLGDLCERLGERRGRPMQLMARALPVPGPSGMWIASTNADMIVYQSETTPAHQNLIVLHEIGHILAGHNGQHGEPLASGAASDDVLAEPDTDPDRGTLDHEEQGPGPARTSAGSPTDAILHELMPDLPIEAVRSALRRETYDDIEEQEAEAVGSLIFNWAGRMDYTQPPSAAGDMERQVQKSLGDRLGWQ